jgi:hypothetical protein
MKIKEGEPTELPFFVFRPLIVISLHFRARYFLEKTWYLKKCLKPECLKCTKVPKMPKIMVSLRSVFSISR